MKNIIDIAMEIILNAGDARLAAMEALDAMATSDFDTAQEKLNDAQQKIVVAHRAQTDCIQSSMTDEGTEEYSLLFAHAQDTLMTINTEINIAKKMLLINKQIDSRLKKLEDCHE